MKTYKIPPQRSIASFSLVEVTLALGVAGFCLIAIFGLVPTGAKTNQDASQRTTANGILSLVVSNLRTIPQSDTSSKQYKRYFPTHNSVKTLYFSNNGSNRDGDKPEVPTADTVFYVTITNVSPSDSTAPTVLDINVSWPYSAGGAGGGGGGGGGGEGDNEGRDGDNSVGGGGSQGPAAGFVETVISLDRTPPSSGGDSDN
jgi:uncharacterized protein (TIGR02598 family)